MRRCRVAVCALLSVAAAALSGLPFQQPASAATQITIVSVSIPAGSGMLSVVTNSATAITSLTVHLQGPNGSLDVSDFDLAGASPGQQTYPVQTPLTSTDSTDQYYLPLGTYTATVDASDSGGDPDPAAGAGSVPFVYATKLTAAAQPASVSYDDRNVTFSGQLNGVPPGGSTEGLSGVPVSLFDANTGVSQPLTTTKTDGSYTAAATVTNDTYVAEVDASDTMAAAGSGTIDIGSNPNRTKVTASVTPQDLKYGQTGTLQGTAYYLSGASVWTALANSPVLVSAGTDSATVSTDSAGKFSWPVPTTFGPSWSALAGLSSQFLQTGQADGNLTVAVPLKLRWFTAKLTPLGYVDTSGCVQVTVANYGPPGTRIQIQYARSAKGPWKYLGRASLGKTSPASCPSGNESYFKGKIAGRLANAYYRASFTGTVYFQHAVSRVVHSWLNTTRITSVNVSPRHVRTGGDATITGRLWRHASSWHPYGGRKVLIIYRYKGKKTWYTLARVGTASSGRFRLTFRDGASATLSALYLGDKTHLWSQGGKVYVSVSRDGATGRLSVSQLRWILRSHPRLDRTPGKRLMVPLS